MNADDLFSPRRGDLFAALLPLLLTAALLVFLLSGGRADAQPRAQIYQNGALLGEYPLSQAREIEVGGACTNLISIEKGKVAVIESDCPGGDCLRCGRIGESGRSIVCLPNRVEIRIDGGEDAL